MPTRIILKSGKEKTVLRRHPWIFSGAIKKIYGTPAEGDVVEVYDNKEHFLAIGHYQIGTIAVRIFSFEQNVTDRNFWYQKFYNAVNLRQKLGFGNNAQTNVFRLIHGEGDGMPGFICDYYNGIAVMQFHSIGMFNNRHIFSDILREIMPEIHTIYNKSDNTLPHKANLKDTSGFLYGKTSLTQVSEYGNKYQIDVINGQKTGFFIDQRENRFLLEKYSENADVLNMFCYTGGFSVAALKGGAKNVHSVDSSAKAVELTDKNIFLNFGDTQRHKSFAQDGFDFLENMEKDKYDLIILDPPAFAKHFNVLNKALVGYKKINKKAFEKIRKGGILFTFSCSQVVSKDIFKNTVTEAAKSAGRFVRILHYLGQPQDHPVNIYHNEGEYLKGLVLYVE